MTARIDETDQARALRLAMEFLQETYPKAHPLRLGREMGGRGFWIVSGTGYTLGTGRTEAEAWLRSQELVRQLTIREPIYGDSVGDAEAAAG